MKKSTACLSLALASAAAFTSIPASAATVLYRVDGVIGTDYLAAALAGAGHTVTTISGDLSGQNLGDYDLVAYANQNNGQPGGDASLLNTSLTGGGKVIYANWTQSAGELPLINSAYTGNSNQTLLSLSQFSAGIGGNLNVVNTGWGVFSTGLSALAGGTVAATFGNGEAAIVVGNGGRSIHNGFLTDTVASQQLYSNQLESLLGSSVAAVPEPATWMMMIFGFGFVGGAMRSTKRRQKVTLSYA